MCIKVYVYKITVRKNLSLYVLRTSYLVQNILPSKKCCHDTGSNNNGLNKYRSLISSNAPYRRGGEKPKQEKYT